MTLRAGTGALADNNAMAAAQMDAEEKKEKLKSALWHALGTTIDAISIEEDINASPQFIGALTELVWTQIERAAQDTEAFTKHAGRKVIDTKDVMLLTRHNESLALLIEEAD